MELELGLKITKTRDDITSISDYGLAKDRAGPVFQSRETNNMFILTARLKGYKRNNIDIKISEDGSKISISGEKPIQEMFLVGWVMLKKEVEITGFNKVFKIPDGVILDQIKAKYDEEEWILKIVMPKLVKGICGARIKEVKEEESDRGRSELEKVEADHILKSVGETSHKGSKESEVQEMEDSESVMEKKEGGLSEKMLDDANGDIIGETFQKEIEESKLEIKDGNGESVRQITGKEGYEAMKTSDFEQNVGASIPQKTGDTSQGKESEVQKMEDSESAAQKKKRVVSDKMLDDANGKIIGETFQKEIEESKWEIKDGNGGSVRQKVGNEGYEVMKESELEQNVGASIPQKIGDTSQDKESKIQKMEENVMEKKEGGISNKMLHDANREIIGEAIQKEIEESKLGSEDVNGERVREKVGKEGYEVMKTSELERKVGVCISQKIGKIGDTSPDKESEVQKMEDSEIVEKKEGGVFDKVLDDANEDIIGDTNKKEIEESKLRIKDGNGESVREKVGKVEYEAMKTSDLQQNVGTRIPQNIGDTSHDKESAIQEMEDSESVVEKKERVVSDKMLDDANGNIIRETFQKEIEESKREIKDGNGESVRQKVGKEGYEVMKTSELDQNVGASIPQKIGDPSQDKESEVQKMEDSGSAVETKEGGISDKMLDDVNREIIGETIQKEIEESKLGIEDGNGERVKEKVGNEGYEVMKTSELEQNVGVCMQKFGDTSQDKESGVQKMEDSESVEKKEGGVSDKMLDDVDGDIIGVTIQKEMEESKLGIEDEKVETVKEKVGKAAYEAVKTSKIEQNVGTGFPQNIGDTSQDKEFEVQEMEDNGSIVEKEKMVSDKKLDDANKNTSGEMIQKEIDESKLGIEDEDGESVREKVGKAGYEAMKTLEQDQNVADHIPSNIGGINQEESKESRIQQIEKTENVEGKMDGGESKRIPVEANKAIRKNIFGEINQKDIEKPKIETEDGDQECMRERAGKEGFEAMITVREEFSKQLPKATLEEGEGLNVSKMQDVKEAKEAFVKRKGKEIECSVEKGEGEKPKRMHMEAKKLIEKDITKETRKEEIEKPNNGTKDSDQQIIQENIVKRRFEVSNGITEELPKQVGEELLDGSKGFKVEKMEEPKEVIKEAMAETESSMEKVEGEESKKRTEEASRVIETSTIIETLQKETEESNIERKARDEPYVSDNIVKGVFEVLGTVQEKLPKQVVEAMAQDEHDKIKYGIVKLKGEGSTKMHVEANEVFEEDTTRDRIEKEIREPKLKSSDQLSGQENVDNKGSDGSKRLKFPDMGETEDVKEKGAKIEESVKKVSGEKYEKIQVEAKGGFRKDITREKTQKEIEDPKIQTKEKDQQCLQEEVSKGRLEVSKAAKEEFPMKMADLLRNKRKGLKDTKIEKAKEVKQELVKQKSEEKVRETEDVKEEGAEIEQFVKKVKGEKHEKIQAEINGGLRKDITRETTWKETKEPKIQSKEKDQQCLQEEMSKGRFEASTTTREFPMQIVDSLAKKRDRPKDKKIEKAEEEVKEEVAKTKTEETKVVESTTKEKFQDSETARITQTLQEVLVEKHPEALDIDTPEREFQSTKGPTTCPKVVSMGFKEVEQGSAKDKTQKTELLPPKIKSKETHESKNERVNQDILKPKRAKEVGEGEQCTYNIESTKVVATIEDQVAKPLPAPRFPSTQQSEVEEKGKLYEGCQAKYETSPESQNEDPTTYLQNAIEMKEIQESKQTETLKPEIPLKEHQKKGEQVTRKDEFHKGQKVGETMQEETEDPKNKIDGRDQQDVQRDVGKRVGIVETIGKEMPQEEYVADAGPIAGMMETKRDLEATLERGKCITAQNVNDEKPRIKEELRKAEIEKVDKAKCIAESMEMTQENGHPRKSKVVEKDAEPQEAISSLPSVTSTGLKEAGPKNEIEELHQKDIKAPKIVAYQGAKPSKLQRPSLTQQSIDEENRKSENVVEAHEASKESPKKNTNIDFQESNEWMEPVENEKLEILQPQILVNQCLEEKQKVDGQEEALGECRFQEINQEEIKGPKREHKAEIVLEKREGPKVAKSEETKEASKQILERKRVKITQTAEDKKPKMKEITPEFEKDNGFKQVVEKMLAPRERENQRESDKVTSKMEMEPPTMIEITPNRGTEKSQTEEMSPLSVEIQRKEPRELSWPSVEHEIPKIEGVQQEKEGERPIHALEATNSKEKGHAQATTTHSKAKGNVEARGEIDKAQTNQLPSPSIEMLSKEPYELDKFSIKEDGSKVESLPQVREGKESIHSIEGTTASEAVADKVAKPSKFSSSSSTQQFEVEEKDKMDAGHEVGNQESQESKKKDSKEDVQESTKSKTDQEVEHIETAQPESPTNQHCINKDQEESHGIHEIEEEKANEQGDEAREKDSQVLEEQKEGKEEASGGKKDDTKRSKKLFVPLVIAGSAFLVSLIVIFVRRRRTRKSTK